ncbi:PilN domain-containing protein [Jeotgalibacillus malaysiensis]|uniref:PilN domain-containing protein n=1 Tax=Jeotgalibacillus malaysiensis TaxID=1508404 RepID=UPI0038501426
MNHDINLLPQKDPFLTKGKLLFIITGTIWLLLSIWLVVMYFSQTAENQELVLEQTRLQTELAYLEQPEIIVEDGYDEALQRAESMASDISPYLDELVRLLPDNAYLVSFDLTESGLHSSIQFETINDGAAYTSRLYQSEMFELAEVDRVETEFPNDESDFVEIPRYIFSFQFMTGGQQDGTD